MRVDYADGVFEELVNLSFYLADDSEEVAQKFLDSCDETFCFLAENKFIGKIRNFKNVELSEIRMWRIKGFEKYLVFYKILNDGVKILHIVHSSTDYKQLFDDEKSN